MPVGATIGSAAIGIGGSLLGGSAQSGGADQAAATQLQMYNQTRQDLLPFSQGGANAFSQLQNFYSGAGPVSTLLGLNPNATGGALQGQLDALRNMPGYQFTQQEGINALDRSAASKGLLLSGGQLRAVDRYGQGLADTTYQQQLTNLNQYGTALSGMASLGESAAAQTGNAGATAAANAGAAQEASGNATANMYGGIANQLGGILQNSNVQSGLSNLFDSSTPSNIGEAFGGGDFIGTGELSDRRAKTDIKKVGKLESGLNVYSYRLKGSEKSQLGVMSDEVREVAPRAVRRGTDGFDRVDYRQVSQLPPKKRAA